MNNTDSLAMTLDEAILIEDQFDRGKLDPLLCGTRELINEARRVKLDAATQLPKPRPPQEHPKRRIHRAAIGCLIGMVGIFAGAYFVFMVALHVTK
ncbi:MULTISPECIES: hypothetical protein [Subtercola]|uniref:Uncharacterized protein n=1 Tax=Subtercola vilae TaxID=2056433 RepID=A0A4T2BRC3_9MICO|nr:MULTISPECIES: hypothetical protein [Subtercola]MEA9986558.1 hypothetical protein [Subtercola sp. RTI3]TIH32056.1 hypothetical protein D4765_16165 [Subtercola vilae]